MTNDEDAAHSSSPLVAGGIILLLISLVCLGTWPALLRLCTYHESRCSGGSLEADRPPPAPLGALRRAWAQRRHPCHAYIDYAASYVLFSSTVPVMLSRTLARYEDGGDDDDDDGSPPPSLRARLPLVLVAMAGGSLLSLGNMSTQWSTTAYGAPLTTVLALQASMTVVVGTSLNYLLEPDRTARPALLACGVASFLAAIALSVRAQSLYEVEVTEGNGAAEDGDDAVGISMHRVEYMACRADGEFPRYSNDIVALEEAHASKSDIAAELREAHIEHDGKIDERSNVASHTESAARPRPRALVSTGIAVAFCGGLCFGFFSPAFNIAVNDPFGPGGGGGLSVSMANACFSAAFAASSVLWNAYLMRHPPPQNDADARASTSPSVIGPSTLRDYLAGRLSERAVAFGAGLLCSLGNVLQFQGGHMAGYAASDLVQAFPLVATAWDVLVFGEFRRASGRVVGCLQNMYVAYAVGIALLALSITR